jgi:alanine racemase
VAGRISMDLMAVDVTDLPANAARRGQMVTLIGEGITVDELAHHFGTIGYEVLSSLGPRYARIYKGGAAPELKDEPKEEPKDEPKADTTTDVAADPAAPATG